MPSEMNSKNIKKNWNKPLLFSLDLQRTSAALGDLADSHSQNS